MAEHCVTSRKLKLLFRHRSMEMGGVEKVLLSLLNNLNPDWFEMTLLLNLNQGELRDEIPAHVRKVYLAEGREDLSTNAVLKAIQLIKRRVKLKKYAANPSFIDHQILKETYDIEIAMDWRDFQAVLNSSNHYSKKIAWFHSEIDHPKFQTLVPQVLEQFPQFDQMVYCSEKIKELMHQHYPDLQYPAEKVIINAIPMEEIKSKAKAKAPKMPPGPFFVGIGRLHTRKGFDKLMEAHAQLLAEGFDHSVVIVGDGEELKNLQQQRETLDVSRSFILTGSQINPYAYLQQADFFIMPSESEAWPLVIAEALILKKPVIATNVGDVNTLIEHGKTGWLINYRVEEIKAAMKLFLTDKELVAEISKNLEKIEEKFDNRAVFQSVEEMLVKLAAN